MVEKYKPQAIIHTGQAGGSSIRLEKFARNKANSTTPYNCGTLVQDQLLIDNGPYLLKSILPLDEIYDTLTLNDIKVKYSESAGAFGCNQVFYLTRFHFADLMSGFIHVPLLPEQTDKGAESMKQAVINKALQMSTQTVAKKLQMMINFKHK